jgi:hypothetical protein
MDQSVTVFNNIDIIYTIKTVKQPRSEFATN